MIVVINMRGRGSLLVLVLVFWVKTACSQTTEALSTDATTTGAPVPTEGTTAQATQFVTARATTQHTAGPTSARVTTEDYTAQGTTAAQLVTTQATTPDTVEPTSERVTSARTTAQAVTTAQFETTQVTTQGTAESTRAGVTTEDYTTQVTTAAQFVTTQATTRQTAAGTSRPTTEENTAQATTAAQPVTTPVQTPETTNTTDTKTETVNVTTEEATTSGTNFTTPTTEIKTTEAMTEAQSTTAATTGMETTEGSTTEVTTQTSSTDFTTPTTEISTTRTEAQSTISTTATTGMETTEGPTTEATTTEATTQTWGTDFATETTEIAITEAITEAQRTTTTTTTTGIKTTEGPTTEAPTTEATTQTRGTDFTTPTTEIATTEAITEAQRTTATTTTTGMQTTEGSATAVTTPTLNAISATTQTTDFSTATAEIETTETRTEAQSTTSTTTGMETTEGSTTEVTTPTLIAALATTQTTRIEPTPSQTPSVALTTNSITPTAWITTDAEETTSEETTKILPTTSATPLTDHTATRETTTDVPRNLNTTQESTSNTNTPEGLCSCPSIEMSSVSTFQTSTIPNTTSQQVSSECPTQIPSEVDECMWNNHTCHPDALCVDTVVLYECVCPPGYTGNGTYCEDVNECMDDSDLCHKHAQCYNTDGSYNCACMYGYGGDGLNCTDIDQCEEGTHHCHPNATCENVVGMDGYNCSCDHGFIGDGFLCEDINECSDPFLHNCTQNETCTNTEGGHECACNEGFIEQGSTCIDIDDCDGVNCLNGGTCVDGIGSYFCQCADGIRGDTCNIYESTWSGWSSWSDDCLCRISNGTAMVSRVRSRSCRITPGYIGAPECEGDNTDWEECIQDVDECEEGTSHCHPNATCENVIGVGLYDCKCDKGFAGDGFRCEDINECSDPFLHNCTQNETCTNTEGGYECACNEGFIEQGSTCIDIDDCDGVNCFNGGTCVDLIGSYFCHCADGSRGDLCNIYDSTWSTWSSWSDDCVCRVSNGTAMVSRVRSRSCSVMSGYIGTPDCDGDDRDWKECIPDVDECEDGTSHCHPNATCENVIGVGLYNCTCDTGFAGDGFRCEDINECEESSLHNCSQNQTCSNTEGSFVCLCAKGFYDASSGEALVCVDFDDCANVTCWNFGVCLDELGSYTCDCPETFSGEHCELYQSTWGEWSPWSEDCGARYVNSTAVEARIRTRNCSDRSDLHGTPLCEGTSLEWQLCEIGREARNFSHLSRTVKSPIQPGYKVDALVLDLNELSLENNHESVEFEILCCDEGKFVLEENGLLKVAEMLDPNRVYELPVVSIDNSTEPSALLNIYNVIIHVNHTEWIYDKTGCPHVTLEREVEEEQPNDNVVDLATELNGDETTRYFLQPGPHSEFVNVDELTGIVSTSKTLDREEMSSFLFDAIAVNHTSTTIVTVNVEVTDINDHQPIFQNTPVVSIISSDAPAGTIVAVVKATDEDIGTNGMFEYALMSHSDAFKISANDGIIRVKDTKALPSDLQVVISVSARDIGTVPRSTNAPRAVELTIVSSSLLQTALVENIEEHIPVGTIVANFTDKLHRENTEDTPGDYRFILQDDGSGQVQLFSLDNTTGILTTAADIDRESPVFQGRFTFTVVAYEEGSCDGKLISVIINVTDINDNTPVFSSQSYVGHIAENAEARTSVIFGNLGPEATDADFGLNGTVTYGIHSPQTPGLFEINTQTAEIDVLSDSAFDRESQAQYNFTITATDRGGGAESRTGTATIIINIDDINDNAPIITSTQEEYEIDENVGGGHLITTLSATDADEGINAEIEYELDIDGGGSLIKLFNIHPITGELKVTSGHLDADSETGNQFTLTISARDRGSPAQTGNKTLTINIRDCNDNAPIFKQNVYRFSVSEDIESGTPIGSINASDDDITDGNSDIRYRILDATGTFFVDDIDGTVIVNKTLDYDEGQTYFEFEVEAVDTGSPPLTGKNSVLQIVVQDANDNRPIISDINQNYSLLSTAPEGSIVTVIQASDIDSGDNGKVKFAMDSSCQTLTIAEETGIVQLNQKLEEACTVTATDKGEEELSSSLTLVVKFIEPETGVTLDPLSFNVNDTYVINVPENIPGDSPLLNISIAEAGLTYAILPESPEFKVDAQGIIYTKKRQHTNDDSSLLNREEVEQHVLVIVAKDNMSGRQASAPVIVKVLDVNDEAPVFTEVGMIFEVTEGISGVNWTVNATDRDAGLNGTVEYQIIDGNINDSLGINITSGMIYVKRPLDREALDNDNDEIILTIKASDKGVPSLSSTKDVRIKVLDINDEPPVFTDNTYFGSIDEEQEGFIMVLQVSAQDKDLGSNADVHYRIISGDGGFRAVAGGSIFSTIKLDRETKDIYSLVVEAFNPSPPWLNHTATVNITVNDINDNPPIFTKFPLENIEIPEDTKTGSSVLRVSAEDMDDNAVSYRLTGGSCRELFSVEVTTGEIGVKERLDTIDRRDEDYSCSVEVTAIDDGVPSLNTTRKVAINITAVNYFWPEFETTFLNVTVREGLEWGEHVEGVLLNATDADEGRNGVVMLEITNSSIGGLFNVTAEGKLIVNVIELDREPDNDHVYVVVSAYDMGTPRKHANVSAVVHITILDINDNVPVLDSDNIELSISQDTSLGTIVQNVTASDRDIGENALVRFRLDGEKGIVQGDLEGVNGLFFVHPTSGGITLNGSLDVTSYLFYVVVENSVDFEGNVNEFEIHSIKVKVNVISTNRHTPIFNEDHYELHVNDTVLPRGHIFENVTVKATDDDSGPDGEIEYSFEDRTCQAFWYVLTIDPWNGNISIDNTLGEEEYNRHCTIYAIDRGNPPKRSNASLIIKDPDERPTSSPPECGPVTSSSENGATVLALQIVTGVLTCLVVVLSAVLMRNRVHCLKTIQTKRAMSTPSVRPEVPVDPKKNNGEVVLIPAHLPVRTHQVLERDATAMPTNDPEPVYQEINERPTPPVFVPRVRQPLPVPGLELSRGLTPAQREQNDTTPSVTCGGTLPPLRRDLNPPENTLGHEKEKKRRKKRKQMKVHPYPECKSDHDSGLGGQDDRQDSFKSWPDSPKAWPESPKAWPESPKAWSDSPNPSPDSRKPCSDSHKVLPNDQETCPDLESDISDMERPEDNEEIDSDERPVYEYDTEATTTVYGSMLSL
ncbi:uncharacterized protein [Branchiostoma lanceolatum]|uniref:uncharacterized protein isoform X2 n=1 Tax=Branchiostoma lanceolatum TaxID=7740 RepID=UPI0034555F9F